ncbi:MAG: hypothetical protein U0Q22_17060 [Acidimicrobiales bacterium]
MQTGTATQLIAHRRGLTALLPVAALAIVAAPVGRRASAPDPSPPRLPPPSTPPWALVDGALAIVEATP